MRGCDGTLLFAGETLGVQQDLHRVANGLSSAGCEVRAASGHGTVDRIVLDIMNAQDLDLLVMGAISHSRICAMLSLRTTRKLLRPSRKTNIVVR